MRLRRDKIKVIEIRALPARKTGLDFFSNKNLFFKMNKRIGNNKVGLD